MFCIFFLSLIELTQQNKFLTPRSPLQQVGEGMKRSAVSPSIALLEKGLGGEDAYLLI
jgi:hypothetical protein